MIHMKRAGYIWLGVAILPFPSLLIIEILLLGWGP